MVRVGKMTSCHRRRWRSSFVIACSLIAAGTAMVSIDPQTVLAQPSSAQREAARRAASEAARGQVEAASAEVRAAAQRVQAQWMSRPEMLRAQMELDAARKELDRVSAPSYERLRQTDAYKQALDQETAATQRVEAERIRTESTQPAATIPSSMPAGLMPGDDRPVGADETDLNIALPSDAQIDAANDRLQVTTRRRQMEEEAARSDPNTAEARARFDRATAEVRALRLQMRAAVLNDPEYKAAQERLAAARAELARAASQNY